MNNSRKNELKKINEKGKFFKRKETSTYINIYNMIQICQRNQQIKSNAKLSMIY